MPYTSTRYIILPLHISTLNLKNVNTLNLHIIRYSISPVEQQNHDVEHPVHHWELILLCELTLRSVFPPNLCSPSSDQ